MVLLLLMLLMRAGCGLLNAECAAVAVAADDVVYVDVELIVVALGRVVAVVVVVAVPVHVDVAVYGVVFAVVDVVVVVIVDAVVLFMYPIFSGIHD